MNMNNVTIILPSLKEIEAVTGPVDLTDDQLDQIEHICAQSEDWRKDLPSIIQGVLNQ